MSSKPDRSQPNAVRARSGTKAGELDRLWPVAVPLARPFISARRSAYRAFLNWLHNRDSAEVVFLSHGVLASLVSIPSRCVHDSQPSRADAANCGVGLHRSASGRHRRRFHWRAFERVAVRRDSRRRELDPHRLAHEYSGRLDPARVQGHASVGAGRHGDGRPRRHPARLHDRIARPDRHGRDPA